MSRGRQKWAGFWWSPWASLPDLASGEVSVPSRCGLYRIRSRGPTLMMYIGEAGAKNGSLASRLQRWKKIGRLDRPVDIWTTVGSDNRVRLLSNWLWYFDRYEISWASVPQPGPLDLRDDQVRKAAESLAMWTNRLHTGHSCYANHGRAGNGNELVGTTVSLKSDSQERGCMRRNAPNLMHAPSSPLRLNGTYPHEENWLSRAWTQLTSHHELTQGGEFDAKGFGHERMRKGPAFYKILSPRLELLKVGYLRSAHRLVRKLRDTQGRPVGAWSSCGTRLRCRCQELVDDMIGAYLWQTGEPPALQFIGG